jgi:hypothetical protein
VLAIERHFESASMPTGAVLLVRLPSLPDWGEPNRWRRDLLTEFDPEKFSYDGPLRQIRRSDHWTLPVQDNSTWFDVAIEEAYYGKGYERGNLTLLIRVAEWLESRIPGAEIWYGHDSADESVAPFGPAQRGVLNDYFDQVGHEPYDKQNRRPADT